MSKLRERFDYPNEKTFCSRCGQECQPLGHLMSRFLMCPTHGEFTIAPVVIQKTDQFDFETGEIVPGDDTWEISFNDEQDKAMWEACREIDAQGLSGRATRTG
jgi:hypothetical protein